MKQNDTGKNVIKMKIPHKIDRRFRNGGETISESYVLLT